MSEPIIDPPTREPIERLSRRVLTSTVWNYVGTGGALLTWFLLTPFVVATLGTRQYGLFVIGLAVLGYAQLFGLGTSHAVTRFVSELHERGDLEGLRNVVATAFVMAIALASTMILAGVALAPFAPRLFGVAPDLVEATEGVMIAAGITAGTVFPVSTLFAVVSGLQRFDITNMLQLMGTFLLAAFTIAALVAGLGVAWVVAAGVPASLLAAVAAAIAIRRVAPELRLTSGRPRLSDVRRLLSFSWAIVFMQGAGLINARTDEIVIAAALPVAQVTPYGLARRASEAPTAMTFQFTRVIMPLSAQMGARDEHDRLRAVFLTGTRLTLATYLGAGVALVTLAGPFLAAWVGEEFRSAGTILAILAIAGGVDMLVPTADSVLQGISRHRPLAVCALISALLNLGMSIAFVGHFGLEGVAAATLIASVLLAAFTIPYSMRVLDVRPGELLREVLAPVLVPLVPTAAVGVGIAVALASSSLALVLLGGTAIVLTYFASYMAIGAGQVERELARRVLGSLSRRLRPVS
ncbi:MAG: polysaccharide biosynthesis C-terminal domain-containing protein [Acidobacteriota bacterium]|nr:polysaccharide biosynthesis C-terminal domain-containing protein [Acidobacteriota bacterium]